MNTTTAEDKSKTHTVEIFISVEKKNAPDI